VRKKGRIIKLCICACLIISLCLAGTAAREVGAGLENFEGTQKPVPAFTDVSYGDWFNPYVQAVAEKGLMVGNSATTFNPLGKVTLAETVTIASRLHSIYHTGGENFQQTNVWYQVYLDYAKGAGIYCPEAADYNRSATRAEFARIVASAFPAEALEEINDISDGEVPDVPMRMTWSEAVYMLYRAGVLTGNNDAGTFAPYSNISRSEVAAIVSRMVDPEARIEFDLSIEEDKDEDEKEDEREPEEDEDDDRDDEDRDEPEQDEPEDVTEPEITEPTFYVQTVKAEAGEQQVAVTISVKNNPGISALALNLSYDNGITLTDIVYNDQLSGETMRPQAMKNPVKLLWLNPFEDVENDFVLATAYFDVSDGAAKGNHQISVTYNPDDVYELSEENVYFDTVQGAITVTK